MVATASVHGIVRFWYCRIREGCDNRPVFDLVFVHANDLRRAASKSAFAEETFVADVGFKFVEISVPAVFVVCLNAFERNLKGSLCVGRRFATVFAKSEGKIEGEIRIAADWDFSGQSDVTGTRFSISNRDVEVL